MSTVQLDEFAEVRAKLENWGRWNRATKMCNLNIKPVLMSGVYGVEEFEDDEALIIEEILIHMQREIKPVYKVMLQEYYYQSTVRQGAERLKLKVGEYYKMKTRGEGYVSGWLCSIRHHKEFLKIA